MVLIDPLTGTSMLHYQDVIVKFAEFVSSKKEHSLQVAALNELTEPLAGER